MNATIRAKTHQIGRVSMRNQMHRNCVCTKYTFYFTPNFANYQ